MLKPLADRVFIDPFPKKTKSEGGIIIPDSAKNRAPFAKGTVVNTGPLVDIEPGIEVLFSAHAGTLVEDGKNKYLAVKYDDVWAIL